MTDQEINIAIAESCGWASKPHHYYTDGVAWCRGSERCSTIDLPNYAADLNAMHEAEKTLNEKQQVWYLQKLTQVRYKDGVSGMLGCMIDKTTFATSRQRAEAFLRTIGEWKE
jgi:hypothetical protein